MKEPFIYKILRPGVSLLFRIIYHPTVIGKNNVPNKGAIVLAGNHTNNLDCLLIATTTKRIVHFLAKEEVTKGFFGPFIKLFGIIPVNRKIHDKDALINAKKCLLENKTIGIFPEGTINRTNNTIIPFKIGAVKMCYDTNTKIVPFIIKGKYKIFGKSVLIEYFEPYTINDEVLDNENNKLMDFIKNKLESR